VQSVDPSGPAAGRVATGADIVAVDSLPVRTMAELRARLYVLGPDQPVVLTLGRAGGGRQTVDVTLSASS
jgi:S1-C subfamily serine protease